MSIRNFKNPWESDNWVLQTDVLDTDVLNTDVLETSVLDNPFTKKEPKSEFIATIHGSWWDDRIFHYLYEAKGCPLAKNVLGALIQGALFQHKDYISDEVFKTRYKGVDRNQARKREFKYRNANWGSENNYPVSIVTGKNKLTKLTSDDIKKKIEKEGEFRLKIYTNGHDKYENNIGGEMSRGSIVIKEVKGMNASIGVHYWSAWFVMNSPFGKMFRHIGNHRDPWTGELLTGSDKIAMTLEGVTDLLTLGTNLKAAAINQGLNLVMQGIENQNWSTFELGIIREIYEMYENLIDKGLDKDGIPMPGAKKYAKVEFLANLIQLGLIVYKSGKFQVVSEKSGGEKINEGLAKKYTINYEE